MPGKESMFIPLDLRGGKKKATPFVVVVEDEEDPICYRFDVFAEGAHVQMKVDERGIDALFDRLMEVRMQMATMKGVTKGAARAMRKKKK